jgi:hypothetical protein
MAAFGLVCQSWPKKEPVKRLTPGQLRSGEALWHWVDVVEAAAWNNPGELKAASRL